MKRNIFLISALLLFSFGMAGGQTFVCPAHLVTVEPDGSASSGSKEALRTAFRAGLPLRVGWELDADGDRKTDVAHWAEAGFLTEFEGEIFTQVRQIHRQTPYRGTARIDLPAEEQYWNGLVGTNGVLLGRMSGSNSVSRHPVRSFWCVDSRVAAGALPAELVQSPDRSTPRNSNCSPVWRLVYQHDKNGGRLVGSKDALFNAVRRGYPIRFAWGTAAALPGRRVSVEHAAEPVFLTIMNNEELFAQLPEHVFQTSYFRPEEAKFKQPSVMWRGLMGTNGSFEAVAVDRATGETIGKFPQRAGIAWFALAPEPACDSPPVNLAVPDGVILIK